MKPTTDQTLTKLVDAAFKQATQKVLDRARHSGTPVIVWKDKAVVELDPNVMLNCDFSEAVEKNRR